MDWQTNIWIWVVWVLFTLILIIGSPVWLFSYIKNGDDSLWTAYKMLSREMFLDRY